MVDPLANVCCDRSLSLDGILSTESIGVTTFEFLWLLDVALTNVALVFQNGGTT